MKQVWKRLTALVLSALLCLSAMPNVHAARMETSGREIRYGTIQVLGVGAASAGTYRAARDDENGIVYIQADDFATIVNGTLSKSGREDDWSFDYSISSWKVCVSTKHGTAQVFYDFDLGAGNGIGYMLYDEFQLTDCLYDELNDAWYFPFEEMMYMMALQWGCQAGTIIVYQPETLLDVLLDYNNMMEITPGYSDLMGEEGTERWSESWNYGWSAAIDELDMGFIWYGMASPWYEIATGDPMFSDYEKETMINAMLLMQSDLPSDGSTTAADGMGWVSDFVGAAATVMDLSSTDTGFPVARELLYDMLGLIVIPSQTEKLSAGANIGAPLLGYLLDAGQTLWVRDHVSADLDSRLAYLEETAREQADGDSFLKLLAEQAAEARETYCGDVTGAFGSLSLDSVMGMLDGMLQLDQGPNWKDSLTGDIAGVIQDVAPDSAGAAIGAAGEAAAFGLNILSWMNLTVGTIDLCVEVAKDQCPTFAEALEAGENAHLCRYLIQICDMLKEDSNSSFRELKACGGMTQELLDRIRSGNHLMMNASLHSHNLLSKLDKYTVAESGFWETEYIVRLLESSKYDQLLLMDETFSDIVSDTEGCVRHDIPVEYVRIIEPVIVTTETNRLEGEHFSATYIRPRVYAESNPNLTAAVDAVLDPIYSEAWTDIQESMESAPSCTYDMQTHTETIKLEGAYSNGGFLMLSIGSGYFNCSIGHNVYRVETYIFDIASGAQLTLETLLNTEENPEALNQLFAIMQAKMDASEDYHALDHSPSDVTAQDIYEEAASGGYGARWELAPDGIYFSIDALNMGVALSGISVSFEEMSDILKEEYRPASIEGTASCQVIPYDSSMKETHMVYENTPAVNALTVTGQTSNLWIEDSYGYPPESITGSCTIFYAFGLQNCIVTMPEPRYPEYGYSVCWQDSDGDHIEVFS